MATDIELPDDVKLPPDFEFKLEYFDSQRSRLLARTAGIERALEIMTQCSLRQIYISESPRENSEASRLLGHDIHVEFSKRWPAEHIKMPNINRLLKHVRNAAIWEDRKSMKVAWIAQKYQMTIRNVQIILQAQQEERNEPTPEAKELQLQLF